MVMLNGLIFIVAKDVNEAGMINYTQTIVTHNDSVCISSSSSLIDIIYEMLNHDDVDDRRDVIKTYLLSTVNDVNDDQIRGSGYVMDSL